MKGLIERLLLSMLWDPDPDPAGGGTGDPTPAPDPAAELAKAQAELEETQRRLADADAAKTEAARAAKELQQLEQRAREGSPEARAAVLTRLGIDPMTVAGDVLGPDVLGDPNPAPKDKDAPPAWAVEQQKQVQQLAAAEQERQDNAATQTRLDNYRGFFTEERLAKFPEIATLGPAALQMMDQKATDFEAANGYRPDVERLAKMVEEQQSQWGGSTAELWAGNDHHANRMIEALRKAGKLPKAPGGTIPGATTLSNNDATYPTDPTEIDKLPERQRLQANIARALAATDE